jgi:hypothetical protein
MINKTILLPKSGVEAISCTQTPSLSNSLVRIIILGFMGASRRNMERYIDAYIDIFNLINNKSVSILCIIPPVSFVLRQGMINSDDWKKGPYTDLAQDVVDLLHEESCKVVLHVCSQNGGFAYRALMNIEKSFTNRVIGRVFDSAPVNLTTQAVDEAIIQALGKIGGNVVCGSLRLLCGGTSAYSKRLMFQNDLYMKWFLHSNGTKSKSECYLFSHHDAISSSQSINNIIRHRRSVNVIDGNADGDNDDTLLWYDFFNSGHMEHIVKYRVQYCSMLRTFLNRILNPEFKMSMISRL